MSLSQVEHLRTSAHVSARPQSAGADAVSWPPPHLRALAKMVHGTIETQHDNGWNRME